MSCGVEGSVLLQVVQGVASLRGSWCLSAWLQVEVFAEIKGMKSILLHRARGALAGGWSCGGLAVAVVHAHDPGCSGTGVGIMCKGQADLRHDCSCSAARLAGKGYVNFCWLAGGFGVYQCLNVHWKTQKMWSGSQTHSGAALMSLTLWIEVWSGCLKNTPNHSLPHACWEPSPTESLNEAVAPEVVGGHCSEALAWRRAEHVSAV